MSLVQRVRVSVLRALERLAGSGTFGATPGDLASGWTVEKPKREGHGDFATNVALVLTKRVGMPPRAIAEAVAAQLAGDPVIRQVALAGPGFLNLDVHPSAVHEELAEILAQGASFGRARAATGERVNVEFVSANPTGPITVAAARNGIFGDAVARLLERAGHRVTREYYVNDFGNQIRIFASSVRLAHENQPRPDGSYQGAYVEEIARALEARVPDPFAADDADLARVCITMMLTGIQGSKTLPGIRKTLADLGIFFDVWFSEESLHRWGSVEVGLDALRASGNLVEKDGATWFLADRTGESKAETTDKDRVVKKTDGSYTYFASDIAYHADKLSRGYDRLVNVWGADHHGYIPRMRNVLDALGLPSEKFEVLLYQLVNILRGGEAVRSSKRAGNVVTADEVMDEIDEAAGRKGAGSDALRFFFLSRSANTTVDFDLELAKKKSLDNPVFYVQYGHARLCSILWKAESIGAWTDGADPPWHALVHPDELAIGMQLARFPAMLGEATELREPHRVVFYVQELAKDFQSYFTRLKNDPILPKDSVRADPTWRASWDHDKTRARLAWVRAIRAVYAAALDTLGVHAPERMDMPMVGTSGDDEA